MEDNAAARILTKIEALCLLAKIEALCDRMCHTDDFAEAQDLLRQCASFLRRQSKGDEA